MRKLPGLGPDGFSRVHIIQFVAVGAIVTGAQGFVLHEATCHESVTLLRGVLFGRIALGNATFQQSHSRSLIDEEHEDSCGVSRKWGTCCHLGADATSDPGCIDTDTSTATGRLSHQRRTRRPTMAPMAAMMEQATAYQIATKAVPSFLQASV
jgi:hypothetical protein